VSFLAQVAPSQNPLAAHSLSFEQLVVHLPLLHRNGTQSSLGPFGVQTPTPSQVSPVTSVPWQATAPHGVPGFA